MTNFEMMRKRLEHQGGIKQEDRMIKDKYLTFKQALLYSYQGASISPEQPYNEHCPLITDETTYEKQIYRALINPDKVKQDYDDKILSVDYCWGIGPGDVITWLGTNTHWLIYLEELTEDAYFRGEIRRCKYKIKFKDKNGVEKYTWAAIRGPVETQIESIQKNQIRIDRPNLSLNILMPLNEDTLYAFDRYSKFLFAGRCWRVQAPDSISMKNVLEIAAEEYYIDEDADDQELEIIDGLVIEQVDPNDADLAITGPTFIRPRLAERYQAQAAGNWSIKEKNYPITLTVVSDTEIEVKWERATSGQFTLVWSDGTQVLEKIIVVESLF